MLPAYRTAESTVAESAYAAQNLTTAPTRRPARRIAKRRIQGGSGHSGRHFASRYAEAGCGRREPRGICGVGPIRGPAHDLFQRRRGQPHLLQCAAGIRPDRGHRFGTFRVFVSGQVKPAKKWGSR